MSLVMRKTARALLLNDANELLLMCIESENTRSLDGMLYGRIWTTLGGAIEEGESIEEAAIRELYEESGITAQDIYVGPYVWHDVQNRLFKGIATTYDEHFIVIKTKTKQVHLGGLTEEEKRIVKELRWFSFDAIKNCSDVIFPTQLAHYLPDILSGNYPAQPIEITATCFQEV